MSSAIFPRKARKEARAQGSLREGGWPGRREDALCISRI